MSGFLTRSIFNFLGWTIRGTISPSQKKCVIIVAPHTSWQDFFLGFVIRKLLKVEINFVAKKELFRPPFGFYFKWVGGIALDRTSNQKKVDAIAEIFESREIFRLALSPEGTRKKTERWKTGFYFIASAARVPVVMVAFDYGKKEVKISQPFFTTENLEEDLAYINNFYKDVKGKVPERF